MEGPLHNTNKEMQDPTIKALTFGLLEILYFLAMENKTKILTMGKIINVGRTCAAYPINITCKVMYFQFCLIIDNNPKQSPTVKNTVKNISVIITGVLVK